MLFWKKLFLSANLMEKKILSLSWTDKYILKALYALKIVFLENNNVAKTCREKKFRCDVKRKNKIF